MNDKERQLHEMLDRVNAFGSAHAKDFPAGTLGHEMFAMVGRCAREAVGRTDGTHVRAASRDGRGESASPKGPAGCARRDSPDRLCDRARLSGIRAAIPAAARQRSSAPARGGTFLTRCDPRING